MSTKKKRIDYTQDPPQKMSECPFYGYKLDKEQLAFAEAIYDNSIDIIFCNAPAGTGKNLVSIGTANIMVQFGMYDEIIYIVSPYGERKQGYLPGDIRSKSQVYYEPLFQTLEMCGVNPNISINDEDFVNQKNGGGYITCITDTFLRGQNLNNAIVLIDEAQNFSLSQLKKTLTRVGDHTKVIVIGHELQCDLDDPKQSGFTKYIEHFKGKERAAVCTLSTNHRSWISQWADEIEG